MIRIIIPFIRLGFHKAVAMRLYSCHRYAVPYLLPLYRGLCSAKAHASPTAGVLSPRCGYRSPLRSFRGLHPRLESCSRYAVFVGGTHDWNPALRYIGSLFQHSMGFQSYMENNVLMSVIIYHRIDKCHIIGQNAPRRSCSPLRGRNDRRGGCR